MSSDPREFNELTRRAAELMADTADVPRVLRSRLGEQHDLTHSAERMTASIETLVREMRSFDATAAAASEEPYSNPY